MGGSDLGEGSVRESNSDGLLKSLDIMFVPSSHIRSARYVNEKISSDSSRRVEDYVLAGISELARLGIYAWIAYSLVQNLQN